MKIILDATAVKALIDAHPEIAAELARTAADQIATSWARRDMDNRLQARLDTVFADRHSKVRQSITSVMEGEVKKFMETNFRRIAGGVIVSPEVMDAAKAAVSEKIDGRLETAVAFFTSKLEKELGPRIDAMIKERIGALFAAFGAKS
jgi:hypothetical protein